MSKTEHRIAYKAGITRSPSDFLCEDGELAECINLTTDNGELKVVTQPERFMMVRGSAFTLLYVHQVNGEAHYVGYTLHDGGYRIRWGMRNADGVFEPHGGYMEVDSVEKLQVTSVGNFLILSDGHEMGYYLWKPDRSDYVYQGNRIPEPMMEFAMVYGHWGTPDRSGLTGYISGKVGDCLDFETMAGGAYCYRFPVVKDQGKYNDLAVGLFVKGLRYLAERKCFAQPFLVRYALELYDGSYTYVSNPIVMLPSVTCNAHARYSGGSMTISTFGYQLAFKSVFDYSEWTDIVKGVVVFVSDEINLYDTGNDQRPQPGYTNGSNSAEGVLYHDGIRADASGYGTSKRFVEHSSKYHSARTDASKREAELGTVYFLPLNQRTSGEILDDLVSTSVFYKLFEAGVRGPGQWESAGGYIKSHVLENITTQEQLTGGDYFSRCPLIPEFMMSYNSRLILAGIRRGFFEGFDSFLPYDLNGSETTSASQTYDIYVYIKTPSGTRVVKKRLTTYEKIGLYFFYPDPRASRAVVYGSGNVLVADMPLKEHPYLNGAYHFSHLPTGDETGTGSAGSDTPSKGVCEAAVNEEPERLANQIYQSEVSNPYVFTYKGNKSVGTGKILALATLTTALSQGQFGQHPVIVFTSEGIWAMEVNGEGYVNPAQPMSREVCINAKTVLETDGSVFFASKKGLMMIVGNQVKCMTGKMNGTAFNTASIGKPIGTGTQWRTIISKCADEGSFLQFIRDEGCFLAYDYIDSRILIVNPSYQYSYLYGMNDGSVSKVIMPGKIVRAVRSYPDCLLQDDDSTVYSLYNKKDETEVEGGQLAFLLTRPMKLAGPVSVSSLRELVNVGYWGRQDQSCVKAQVFISDNLYDWHEAGSRFGTSAKYIRIALYINQKATERLSGTIIRIQERRGENARV